MEQNRRKNKIWLIFAGLFLIAAVISGGIWLRQQLVIQQAQEEREQLASMVNGAEESSAAVAENSAVTLPAQDSAKPVVVETPTPEPQKEWKDYSLEEKYQAYLDTYGIEIPEKNLNFEELQATVNSDIYAWIYVPGTNVDDPVVQHPTEDSHYLYYNLDGTKGYPGGIYTEGSCNSKDFTDRMTVIYGHNMKNGTGFGTLHNFEDSAVFEKNRYIFIYLPDDIKVYEIFAAYEGSSNHIIYGHEWDDDSWVQYLSDTLLADGKRDNALDAYEFHADDLALTLSTCIRNSPNQRYLVQGVLLDEPR